VSDTQALSTLLTLSSFLLAVLSAIAALSTPGRNRLAKLDVTPVRLAYLVTGLVATVSLGAGSAWSGIYIGGGELLPIREVLIAAVLLAAILSQPILALLVARGLRTER
jgi:hypothetical protein